MSRVKTITLDNITRRNFLQVTLGAINVIPQPPDFFENVQTPAQWSKQRQRILSNMELVMGPLPRKKKLPLDLTTLETVDRPGIYQTKIGYLSEKDDQVPAYLLVPKNLRKAAPAVLCLHQTVRLGKSEPAGLGGNPDLHYAKELAERGYITLAPDYPNFGDYSCDPYARGYCSTTMKGIWNHRRAVDVLQSLPLVARDRIGAIGHSLGGHNTLFAGVFDQRIRVMVTSCGFNSFKKYYKGDLTGWSQKKYMPLIAEKYGKNPVRMPFDFPEVIAALAPRPLFINAPLRDSNFEVSGVRDCVQAAGSIYGRVFKAGDRLVALYPDVEHEFPYAIRQAAYEFLDKWLKSSST